MQARVKADARWAVMTACGGREFVKSEWRAVPTGAEAEAARMAFLEVREADPPAPLPAPDAPLPPPEQPVVIDLRDGVQPDEASMAGRVLQAVGRDISTEMPAAAPAPVAPPKKKAKRK
jgi:hypothetical protein